MDIMKMTKIKFNKCMNNFVVQSKTNLDSLKIVQAHVHKGRGSSLLGPVAK